MTRECARFARSIMSSSIKFALVGCGGIARHHLKALQECATATQVAAVVDTRRENAEELIQLIPNKCKVFSNFPDLLSWGRFDAVVLMVPHHLHEPYARACLHANKHVLLEKPLSHSIQSALSLLEEARKSRSVFMVGEQSPHWPEVARASELLAAGEIGQPYHVLANYWESVGYTTFLNEAHFFAGGNWRFDPDKAGGGVLMDGATHWTRPLTMWFGAIEEVVGAVSYPLKESRCETLAHSLFRFTSGHTGALYCHFNRIPMATLPFFQIFGDKGEITIDGSFGGGMSYRNKTHPGGVVIPSLGGFSSAFTPQMKEFVSQVEGGYHGNIRSGEKALGEVVLAQATYKSTLSNRWEKLQTVLEEVNAEATK